MNHSQEKQWSGSLWSRLAWVLGFKSLPREVSLSAHVANEALICHHADIVWVVAVRDGCATVACAADVHESRVGWVEEVRAEIEELVERKAEQWKWR